MAILDTNDPSADHILQQFDIGRRIIANREVPHSFPKPKGWLTIEPSTYPLDTYEPTPLTVGDLITILNRIEDKSMPVLDEATGNALLGVIEEKHHSIDTDHIKAWLSFDYKSIVR